MERLTAKGVPSDMAQQEAEARFDDLFQQYWNRICRVLERLVGDPAEAEDLALDAFVQLYQRPPRQGHNLGSWLYRVATNLGLNALRARQRRQRYEEEAGLQALQESDPDWDPVEAFESAQRRQMVRQALSQMPTRSAQLLVLRHSGLSYKELAQALGVKPSSIGTLLARAETDFERRYSQIGGHDEQETT